MKPLPGQGVTSHAEKLAGACKRRLGQCSGVSLEGGNVPDYGATVSRGSALQRYVSLAVILAFIGAGIWWRGSGEPTALGLIIVGVAAAALVVAVTFTWRSGRR